MTFSAEAVENRVSTLFQKPSWVNRAGRIDRSACLELRASEIWRRCELRPVERRPRRGSRRPKAKVRLEAIGRITIDAALLYLLHRQRQPRELQGDLRTAKSNVMKGPYAHQDLRPTNPAAYWEGLPPNPNKGAAMTKKLGLWGGGENAGTEKPWTQMIQIERWRLHERLAQHFLVCPNRHAPSPAAQRAGQSWGGDAGNKPCLGKAMKLFMPLATEREILDAELAEGFLMMLDARVLAARSHAVPLHVPPEVMELRALLVDRYGVLFRGRRLLCRNCLGMRYGQPPDRKRGMRGRESPAAETLRTTREKRVVQRLYDFTAKIRAEAEYDAMLMDLLRRQMQGHE